MKTRLFTILIVLISSFFPFAYASESLQTGETLDDTNIFGWFVLTMSLFIVFAYITMKIKKRRQ